MFKTQVQSKERPPRSSDGHTTSTNRTVIPGGVNRWNPSGASKTAGSTDNGIQKNDTGPSSAWNFSGHKAQNSSSSDSGAARTNGSSQWGDWDSNDKGKAKQSNSSLTTGWGVGDGWGNGGGGGWANVIDDSPAENTAGGSWSSLPEKTDDSSNTNSRGGDKENDRNSGTGWDGASLSWNLSGGGEWGQPSGDKESHTKDKGKEKDDGQISSPQTRTSFSANSNPPKKALNSDLPRLQPTSPFLQNTPESAGYDPMSSVAAGIDSSGKLKKEVLEFAKLDLSQDKMKTLKYRGPAGRKTLYTNTVKSVKCNCSV